MEISLLHAYNLIGSERGAIANQIIRLLASLGVLWFLRHWGKIRVLCKLVYCMPIIWLVVKVSQSKSDYRHHFGCHLGHHLGHNLWCHLGPWLHKAFYRPPMVPHPGHPYGPGPFLRAPAMRLPHYVLSFSFTPNLPFFTSHISEIRSPNVIYAQPHACLVSKQINPFGGDSGWGR